jgi:ABC-type Zn uptake system ZnuABC Zn-binding protein ZnuA
MNRKFALSTGALLIPLALLMSACAAPLPATAPAQPTSPPATEAPTAPPAEAPTMTPPARLRAVATFSILADLVQNVAGEKIELVVLVDRDTDTHEYEPSPSDAAKLADAQLIFENGLMFETWLDRLYEASGSRARRVVLSEGINPRSFEHAHDAEEHKHSEEGHSHEGDKAADHSKEEAADHAHEHGEFDPHIWQDVQNAIQMVRNIAQALSEADPANADFYAANAQAYIATLEALDAEIVGLVEQLPEERRKLVTSHEALGYFADRYGLVQVGTVLGTLSAEAREPSAQDIARLIEAIKGEGAKVIFLENVTNPQLVDRVAKEASIEIGPSLYTDALGAPGSPGATYVEMMRYNARVIVEALSK